MKTIFSLLSLSSLVLCVSASINGMIDGKASFYDNPGPVFGACGTEIYPDTQLLVAVPTSFWVQGGNPNNDPLCRATVNVRYNGVVQNYPILDKCPGCAQNQIDLSKPAFADIGANHDDGKVNVQWEIVYGGGSSGGSSSSGTCRTQTVDAGEGCWATWTRKCGNEWNDFQFKKANPKVNCNSLLVGDSICCNVGSGNSSSSSGSGTSGTNGGTCRTQTVDAGEGCWATWTRNVVMNGMILNLKKQIQK